MNESEIILGQLATGRIHAAQVATACVTVFGAARDAPAAVLGFEVRAEQADADHGATARPDAADALAATTRRVSSTARSRLSSARVPARMWPTQRANASASK